MTKPPNVWKKAPRKSALAACILTLAGMGSVNAQPMSAIDWLTDSVDLPQSVGNQSVATSQSVLTGAISVRPLGESSNDGLGLIDADDFGLNQSLWEASDLTTLTRLFARTNPQVDTPATRKLLVHLLTANATPPAAFEANGDFLLARIDKLLSLGALHQAAELLEKSDLDDPRFFQRWFDVRLLLGTEDAACEKLKASPDLSPTFPTTIFCLARAGDWDAAALALDTAEALGLVTPAEDALLLRFLDGGNPEENGPLTLPNQITPLMFRLYEAVGEPIPTKILPRAFSHSDLGPQNGWKARISAAERLAAAGAISGAELFALYREQAPAASGGVWDRARAVQDLDRALSSKDDDRIASALPHAWSVLAPLHLGPVFAEEYGERLVRLSVGSDADLPLRIALLSPLADRAADLALTRADPMGLLGGIWKGQTSEYNAYDKLSEQLKQGLEGAPLPPSLNLLVEENRIGEAALIALSLFVTGADGDAEDLIYALALLGQLGLDEVAREAALSLAVQERRG